MRLGIVGKLLLPLSILFTLLTYITTTLQLDLFAEEQIKTTKRNALGTAGEAAMLFDTSVSNDILKRIVTVIALDDHVVQALILNPMNDEILASSRYRHAKQQLVAQPSLIKDAYQQAKQSGVHYFTDAEVNHYALAYPIVAVSDNNTDTLDFVLLIYFDKLLLNNQYADYRNRIFTISAGFLLALVTLLYLLVSHFVRKPLTTFSDAMKQPSVDGEPNLVLLNSNDEFADIADEFNRMRTTEVQSLETAHLATQAAQELATKKSQFLANMSHELRTPINGILGMAQLCEKATSEQQRQHYIGHLTHSAQLLLSVVNDILDFSKLDEHGIELHYEDTILSNLVMRVASLAQISAHEKDLNFSVVLSEQCPYIINVDQQRTQQILLNLLNNAVKFTDRGQITFYVDFKWVEEDKGTLVLSVIDTGIGIASEHMTKLFDPFEQADTSISRNYGGTGLGLAICKELLSLMDGEIKAVSTPGKGSQFRITIPCSASTFESYLRSKVSIKILPGVSYPDDAPDRAKALCKQIDAIAQHRSPINLEEIEDGWRHPPYILNEEVLMDHLTGKKPVIESTSQGPSIHAERRAKVLLVEDNEINALVAKTMLDNMGHDVTLANDGSIAVNEHKKTKFDIILMDIQMPIMDGYKSTQIIRSSDTNTIIVGLSANVLPDEIERAYAVGMNDYLHKPVILEELKTCIEKHMT